MTFPTDAAMITRRKSCGICGPAILCSSRIQGLQTNVAPLDHGPERRGEEDELLHLVIPVPAPSWRQRCHRRSSAFVPCDCWFGSESAPALPLETPEPSRRDAIHGGL